MSGQHPSYGEFAEGIGRTLYELLEEHPTQSWPLIVLFIVPLVLLMIAAVNMSLPALVLVAVVAWLASARLDGNPPMRLGAVCLGFTFGLLVFHVVFMGVDLERRSASFAMGFFTFFGVLPACAVAWSIAWFHSQVQAERRNTYYVDVSALTDEELRIVRKRTDGTLRRHAFRPSLLGDHGRLTAADLRQIFEDEARDLEIQARAVEAENARASGDLEAERLEALRAHIGKLAGKRRQARRA
jgi:hypothetical protein